MRIALVVHGFTPHECTGVETHVAALAKALTQRGLEIEVFAPRTDPRAPEFAQRHEVRDGYNLTWLVLNRTPQSAEEHLVRPGVAAAFGEFLERTRPALVHFQHVLKLGVGLLEETVRRKIPSVYTAHDYFPICHRVVLARPDLSRCSTIGDSQACARCDAAVSFLNEKKRWSDYHAGVLQESLSMAEQRELALLLDQEQVRGELTEISAMRTKLDQRRRAAFAAVDLVLAPTDFLREQLIAGGFDPARIEKCEYGISTEALAHVPPPVEHGQRPLTFGYIGGALKHKGLHILLEAFARLKLPARLVIRADSTDREYVDEMRTRAQALGAEWLGGFAAADLARVLAGIDVLVVPSIWWENAPFVIREAFAAGRPVITSDLPALRESVHDGVDGLLVAPGDVAALSAAMERLSGEPRLLEKLAGNSAAPHSLEEQCDELIARYSELIAASPRAVAAQVPASARAFAARVLELESRTVNELAARAAAGLASLAKSLGVDASEVRPVDTRELALEHLRDARREIAWRVARDHHGTLELERERALRTTLTADLERALAEGDHARQALSGAQAELSARARQLEVAALAQTAARSTLEAELQAHATTRAALEQAQRALAESLRHGSEVEARLQALGVERAELEQRFAHSQQAAALAVRQAEALDRARAELTHDLARLQVHAHWLERESAALVRRFGVTSLALSTAVDFSAAQAALDLFERELAWRRGEMLAAQDAGGAMLRAMVGRSGLGRRLRSWGREA